RVLRFGQPGASEIYADGTLLRRIGIVGSTVRDEVPASLLEQSLGIAVPGTGDGRPHVTAIRYSCMAAADPTTGRGLELATSASGIGFHAHLGPLGGSPVASARLTSATAFGRGGYAESF